MNGNTVVFRCDASTDIGAGHAMRCLTLARILATQGWHCIFAVRQGTLQAMPQSIGSDIGVINLSRDGLDEADEIASKIGGAADLLVIDHYGHDARFASRCRQWASTILVIDDLENRQHDCDVLVDAASDLSGHAYRAIVPDHCRILAGPSYAIIDHTFFRERVAAIVRRKQSRGVSRILVTMGALDGKRLIQIVLEGLEASGLDIAVDVAVSSAAPSLAAIKECGRRLSIKMHLHEDAANMASLMAKADIAIGTPGATSWERCCVGLPSIILTTAENQKQTVDSLVHHGAAKSLGDWKNITPDIIADAIQALAVDTDMVAMMGQSAAKLCDGLGARRAIAALGNQRANDDQSIMLRRASQGDAFITFKWQRHPATRKYMRNTDPPDSTVHKTWFSSKLADPESVFEIILHGGKAVGTIRLDNRSDGSGKEIAINIDPASQQLGIAKGALALFLDMFPDTEILAKVHPENVASHKLFQSAGFTFSDQLEMYVWPAQDMQTRHTIYRYN